MKKFACLAGLALLLVLFVAEALRNEPSSAVRAATLADVRWGDPVNDVAFDRAALTGKVVVVQEWGVNCAPCIVGLPHLAALAKSGDAKGLVVVGLERQQSARRDILKVIKEAKVDFAIQSGGAAPGGTGSIPHACVFDVSGSLVFSGNPHDQAFEAAVAKALGEVKDSSAAGIRPSATTAADR